MRRYAGKEFEHEQESYAKIMKRKTKGIIFVTWIEKVVKKWSEYEKDELYHFSSRWSQCYALVSVISVNWVSIARIEKH